MLTTCCFYLRIELTQIVPKLVLFVVAANEAQILQRRHERERWLEVLKRYGKKSQTAEDVVALVPPGHDPIHFCSPSEQISLQESTPATDAQLLLSLTSPSIPPTADATGRVSYHKLENIGQGGFGEIFKGFHIASQEDSMEQITTYCALKRALPHIHAGSNIGKHMVRQVNRIKSLQREADVYFSSAFNTGKCRHLALLYDVANVRNSDGDMEPLLVLQWADGPCTTLSKWLQKHAGRCAPTIQRRLSFAIQIFAGLRELHHADEIDPFGRASQEVKPTTSAFVHNDIKPSNMLLFGGGEDERGPVRLALTDFGMTERCGSGVAVGGTPCYMAPEQWLGQPASTPARDMWAAGVVLAQLFGDKNTMVGLTKLFQGSVDVQNAATQSEKAIAVNELTVLALQVADAMFADSIASKSMPTIGGLPVGSVRATHHVQSEMAALLRDCFSFYSDAVPSTDTVHITSTDCEGRLIALWDRVFDAKSWSSFNDTLPEPALSPFAETFSAAERKGTFYRLVPGMLSRLMLRRCDALLRIARERHADAKVLKALRDRLEPHKYVLRMNLATALRSARECFDLALRTAKTPACERCGRQIINKGSRSLLRSDNVDSALHECMWCRSVRFCSAECLVEYQASLLGWRHYQCGDCRSVSSWRRKGWSVVGAVQSTELMLIRAEEWEARGLPAGPERDDIVDQVVQMQTAWERVYTTGPVGTSYDKYMRGVAVGVSRYTTASTDLYSPMMQACHRGLDALVAAVLDAPTDVVGSVDRWVNHTEPQDGRGPLYVACRMGHTKVVEVLLEKAQGTINVNQARTDYGTTALFTACQHGRADIVTLLLDKAQDSIDVNVASRDDGLTPLILACQDGRVDIVELLLNKAHDTIDVNKAMSDGSSPLLMACYNGHEQVVAVLLDKARHQLDVNLAIEGNGCTPLFAACHDDRREIVALLLDKARDTIDVNKARTDNGCTPLSLACYFGHVEIVTLLLDKAKESINVNLARTDARDAGTTPLLIACEFGHTRVVRLLLEKTQGKIDANQARNEDGATPLLMACQGGHAEVVALLLDKNADAIDVNKATKDGNTPLTQACQDGFADVVRLLLEKCKDKLDVNLAMDERHTPLFKACRYGHVEVVQLLLDKVRDKINVKCVYKPFLMRVSFWFGIAALCRILLKRGVPVSVWVVCIGCCCALARYTRVFYDRVDARVGSTLLRVWGRSIGAVLRHPLAQIYRVLFRKGSITP